MHAVNARILDRGAYLIFRSLEMVLNLGWVLIGRGRLFNI